MRLFPRPFFRRAVPMAIGLGSAIVLFGVPSRGQQPTGAPAPRVTVPASVTQRGDTRLTLDLGTATGLRLARPPRLRVVDAKDQLVELLPTFLNIAPATGSYRDLHTEQYLPGTYRVRAEVDFLQADGQITTVVSPWVTFTVAGS